MAPHSLVHGTVSFLEQEGIRLAGAPVVVGVSGGVDSVVLLDVLVQASARPTIVHVNYGLRGKESDADEALVRDFCQSLALELVVSRVDQSRMRSRKGISLQEFAREIRYHVFEETAAARSIPWIATAHHLDDQAETILMRLMRGTGPDGFAGIPVRRAVRKGSTIQVIRPLLNARKSEIIEYAASRRLPWREDSSNTSPQYARSLVRSELLPVIVKHFGVGAVDRIARSARLLAAMMKDVTLPALDDIVIRRRDGVELPLDELSLREPQVRGYVVLQTMRRFFPSVPRSRAVVDAVVDLAGSQVGRCWKHPDLIVTRERDGLLFSSPESQPGGVEAPVPLALSRPIDIPGGLLRADILANVPAVLDPGTGTIAFVDAGKTGTELTVDAWRTGDTIRLLGPHATKKVSDLLTEEKVPHVDRNRVRVVRSGNSVVWVAGYRLSSDFAVTAKTDCVLMLTVMPVSEGIYFRSI